MSALKKRSGENTASGGCSTITRIAEIAARKYATLAASAVWSTGQALVRRRSAPAARRNLRNPLALRIVPTPTRPGGTLHRPAPLRSARGLSPCRYRLFLFGEDLQFVRGAQHSPDQNPEVDRPVYRFAAASLPVDGRCSRENSSSLL